nr:amino acid permease [Deinococcus sp. Marseille-Q6407]
MRITLTSALVAIFANSIASQATSSRLIFSMARDGQLPRALAKVNSQTKAPQNAMLFIAALSLVIGIVGASTQGFLTTLVTFGAITAYILLNLSVIYRFGIVGKSGQLFTHWISPLLGTAVLSYALWNASTQTKLIGLGWLVLGVLAALYFRSRQSTAENPA